MKRNYAVWYLLLFLVMITGTLASMALNDYGMKLMGAACGGFSAVFLAEAVRKSRKATQLAELVLLAVISGLLSCRCFFIEVPAGQTISAALFGGLTLLYIYVGFGHINRLWSSNRRAAIGILGYYGALVSFLFGFSSALVSISPDYGTLAGMFFFGLFVVLHVVLRTFTAGGETFTLAQLALAAKNRSAVTLAALLTAGFFYTLINYSILPPLYAGDMPTGYTRLIQRAESGKDPQAAKGNPRYREFWKAYKKFLEER